MNLSYNAVRETSLGAVASAAIRTLMESSPDGDRSVKVNDVNFKIFIDNNEINMERFTEILNADSTFTAQREVLRGLRAELSNLKDAMSGQCDPSEVYRQVSEDFWNAISNVHLDLRDHVSPNMSESDFDSSSRSYALDSIENISSRLDRLNC